MPLRPNQTTDPDPTVWYWDEFLQRKTPPSLKAVSHRHRDAIRGKRLLITGAGGSIGSALARALAHIRPAELVLLDSAESALHKIAQTLEASKPIVALTSVTDPAALDRVFGCHRPQIVFHAAALKHVPLGETTPFAVMDTNATGTQMLTAAAAKHDCEQLVMVSTDKAADPLSLMGASKRIAELVLLTSRTNMRTAAVRLGNVLGSSGSVVPLFLNQIARGGPLTVTHPEARRYFMTITETVDALLSTISSACSTGVLAANPGPPIRILDLARHLIAQGGQPETQIVFTSLRPGDKLEESLLSASEAFAEAHQTPLRSIQSPRPEPAALKAAMHQLQNSIDQRDLPLLIETVQHLVRGYQPSKLLRGQLTTLAVGA